MSIKLLLFIPHGECSLKNSRVMPRNSGCEKCVIEGPDTHDDLTERGTTRHLAKLDDRNENCISLPKDLNLFLFSESLYTGLDLCSSIFNEIFPCPPKSLGF